MKYKIQHYVVRMVKDRVRSYPVEKVRCAEDAANVLRANIGMAPHEEILAVYLNGHNKIMGLHTISIGGVSGCATTPKDIFRGAIGLGAAAMILGHNHPSGDCTPSLEDVHFTDGAVAVGKLLGLPVLDHIVIAVGSEKYASMGDMGFVRF